jgi:methylmalonyl-CoA/ethylmalonyl-CoA epimerase
MDETPDITQVAIVVYDLEATMKAYHRLLGWGPWRVYDFRPPLYGDLTLHEQPADYGVRVAETRAGPIAFELLQPLGDGPNPYRHWLDAHGEGLHHIACMTRSDDDAEAMQDRLIAAGGRDVTSGRVGDSLRFAFIDVPALKVIIETGTGHSQDLVQPLRTFPADH